MSSNSSGCFAFIPARAGSKGLPGKNIRPLLGKPLIAHSIQHALECGRIDRVFVSTDGAEIADEARKAGAEVMMRPDELAGDTALPKDALRYHLGELSREGVEPDRIVLLQPTSPLRSPGNILDCLARLDEGSDSAATFVEAPVSPSRLWAIDAGEPRLYFEGENPWEGRQQLQKAFALNGAVYAVKTRPFLEDDSPSFLPGKSSAVIMSEEDSIDIDTLTDFVIAESILNMRQK